MKFLQLIRFKNIIIMITTLLVVRYGIFYQSVIADYTGLGVDMELQFPLHLFILLILSTTFISAGGYIINDYLDVKSDTLNKPDKVIIGTYISKTSAFILHWIFAVVGVGCGAYVSFEIGYPQFTLIFLFIAGSLWFYSALFSKEVLVGNLLIAFLVAIVPIVGAIFEIIPLMLYYKNILIENYMSFDALWYWSLGFAVFAFLLTLIREIVKDIEDLEGDAAYGRTTLPIAYGITVAKRVVYCLCAITIISAFVIWLLYIQGVFSLLYIVFGIIATTAYVWFLVVKADSVKEYHTISTYLKIILVLGLVYAIIQNYI